MSVDVSGSAQGVGRTGGRPTAAAGPAAAARGRSRTSPAGRTAASAVATELSRAGRQLAAHRSELIFLAATLAFAIVVGVLGYAALPTF